MANFKLYIEYDGSRYSGWQTQENAKTIQGVISKGIKTIFKTDEFEFQGSGRTDSGVHALCQIANLKIITSLAPEIIRIKLNDQLPYDINILEVEKTSSTFHSRRDAKFRSYIYQISRRRNAFLKPYVWWIKDKLDFERMKSIVKLYEGMNDFASFAEKDKEKKSTKVLIHKVELLEYGDLILFRIVGSHFLWKMVRRIVGVLAEAGRGHFTEEDVKMLLAKKSDIPAKYTAPPSGLFLERAFYENEKLNNELLPALLFPKNLYYSNKTKRHNSAS